MFALAVTDRWHPLCVVSVVSCKVAMVVEKVTLGLTVNQTKPKNRIHMTSNLVCITKY